MIIFQQLPCRPFLIILQLLLRKSSVDKDIVLSCYGGGQACQKIQFPAKMLQDIFLAFNIS